MPTFKPSSYLSTSGSYGEKEEEQYGGGGSSINDEGNGKDLECPRSQRGAESNRSVQLVKDACVQNWNHSSNLIMFWIGWPVAFLSTRLPKVHETLFSVRFTALFNMKQFLKKRILKSWNFKIKNCYDAEYECVADTTCWLIFCLVPPIVDWTSSKILKTIAWICFEQR